MKLSSMMLGIGFAIATVSLSPSPVLAANARHPHSNVDKRLDKGGDTGDSQVDKLNQQQLDSVRAQNGSGMGGSSTMGAPLMQQTAPSTGLKQ